ncbi:MAG: NADPH-dependent FMN reductase [Christensenellales bacterium]|jgi:chromate reductase
MAGIKVLGITGSLRKGSYNTMALKAAGGMLSEGSVMEIADISGIPFFSEDVEAQGEPQSVTAFKQKIHAADAIMIATPEYNYSIPAVLKNALDWASRGQFAPLVDKPLAILSASPSIFGGARVQYHLRQVCVAVGLLPINTPQVFIPSAHTKFDAQGNIVNSTTQNTLQELVRELEKWTHRLNN